MNTNNVKKYAPRARKAFIAAISKQAAKYGITEKKIEAAEKKGDMVLFGDRPFPAAVIRPRERLVKRIEQQSFEQVIEHVAYSWFNRLCAIRYMERKGFLDHGRRVLSAADGSAGVPQILEECLDVDFPELDQTKVRELQAKVRELKLDGNKDEELYRELLLAQCHALHQAMPFLFEAIADESELLLPENLTKTDSLIRDLVESVPDEDWEQIEIIGWLYQFYISEKKDQVIGKVVKSEDIPAATQLFTPNWIVQYLVQNSVGRQWLQTYPDSPLKEKMPYYIEPAEQTQEVQEQLATITPSEISPESIKVLDPACGSGHILIEAYKVLKAIYEERGYRTRDIPKLILENNLHGLDIDDRAGQLAGFTLMMLAREDDRRIFDRDIRLNVLSIQESEHIDLPALWQSLNLTGEWGEGTLRELPLEEIDPATFSEDERYQLTLRTLNSFKQAKTFGSLIYVPQEDYEVLKELYITLIELGCSKRSTLSAASANQLIPYIHQALLLAQKYDSVIANPPYMGRKAMNAELKTFARKEYPNSKSDLCSVFIERSVSVLSAHGIATLITMQSWMFLSSFENLRKGLIANNTILSLCHIGYNSFPSLNSKIAQAIMFVLHKQPIKSFIGKYLDLNSAPQSSDKNQIFLNKNESMIYESDAFDFQKIPGSPIAYWADKKLFDIYKSSKTLQQAINPKQGMATGDNDRFLRYWWEVNRSDIRLDSCSKDDLWSSGGKYARYNKGGEYCKWYGNNEIVIRFDEKSYQKLKSQGNHCPSEELYFKKSLTWSDITTKAFAARFSPTGAVFDVKGSSGFPKEGLEYVMLAILCSDFINYMMGILNPSVTFQVGDIGRVPFVESDWSDVDKLARGMVETSKRDYDLSELSLEFTGNQLICSSMDLIHCCRTAQLELQTHVDTVKDVEEELNKIINEKIGLDIPLVKSREITLNYNPECEVDIVGRLVAELISYTIGCMMGRYSFDRQGIMYAYSGGEGFSNLINEGVYETYPADDDGIIPLTDQEWFPDDATNRFREFVKVVWGEEHLQESLDFVAESLCLHAIKPKKSEPSMDTIRRYMSAQFYKDHLKTYKKRPIYWLFSSGKQKAFECLVYLHRYNEGTLARMRTEYVIPLTSKLAAYVQKLEKDKEASGSAAEIKRIEKEIAQLHKQQAELSEFDEKLRHYADQRISLDLDDGVKVNYGKFGDLLAEVKTITGLKPKTVGELK